MPQPTRDQLASLYLDQLPFPPYPVQEEALLTYFTAEQGVLVCAPTGTGKTLIAEAALFEALHTGTRAYYTTPLIALTEQKLLEMQAAAVRWGFSASDVGLVTGNRRVNPDAPILVVVAEILFNRLLHASRERGSGRGGEGETVYSPAPPLSPSPPRNDNLTELAAPAALDFSNVSAVVMDEFHNFADPERGIVWELALGLLPAHVRLLLLSATVGNAFEFTQWLKMAHGRSLELVQGTERKVPLSYHWVGDQLLAEQIELMVAGDDATRHTPALVFCFNRDECWNVAELLKGKPLLAEGQQKRLADELAQRDFSEGAGPKLKAILQRGVGVHHAGVLPRYRRIVEELFQQKLLSVCVCTETLAAGINLPARSVVLPTLLKGKPGEMKLIDPSSAHQIFGRAGRPQFDKQGYVFALAHEDDVKILRWREKFDQIPENTKDPGLLKMKKDLKRKQPTRRSTEQYWTKEQWEKLRAAPPQKLASRGPIPWRLLAHMLEVSPEVEPIRRLVGQRLMEGGRITSGQKQLDEMLLTLNAAGYVTLEPPPPKKEEGLGLGAGGEEKNQQPTKKPTETERMLAAALAELASERTSSNETSSSSSSPALAPSPSPPTAYRPLLAHATPDLAKLLRLRGINPLYGVYLVNQLGIASREERIQAFESVLEMPGSVAKFVRVPRYDDMPPGPLATTRLDIELLQMGLATPEQLGAKPAEEDEDDRRRREMFPEEKVWPLTLGEKLRLLFDATFPHVHSLFTNSVWAAGEVLEFGGNFNKFITSRGLQKQEGVIFRHLLRMILLVKEFLPFTPPDCTSDEWQAELRDIADRLTDCCHRVDPTSTDQALAEAEE
ncbi:MAG: DEAD/DEAH box helicase [Pirellulaceae bacterium]|nr:DEAD/DEAH box helicase [Pirellulaceae bacterium]